MEIQTGNNRIAILGASRGLGRALAEHIFNLDSSELLLISRKTQSLEGMGGAAGVDHQSFDFSKLSEQEGTLLELESWSPQRIFYVAGGGPFGAYEERSWKDHEWAFQVNLLFPARLIHWALRQKGLQLTMVGSAIAENQPEPYGASYGASKKALSGLIESIVSNGSDLDLRLFSPGYMDTDLLPKNAFPRQKGLPISSPEEVAKQLWDWSEAPLSAEVHSWHLEL